MTRSPFLLAPLLLLALAAPALGGDAATEVLEGTENHLVYPPAQQVVTGDLRFSMKLLTAWGASNTALGLALVLQEPKDSALNWHGRQDLVWGVSNLALGALALARSRSLAGRMHPPSNLQMARLHGVFAIVDIAALIIGSSLAARGDPQGRGTGQSLLLQGGSLLVFDLAYAIRYGRAHRQLAHRRSRIGAKEEP